MRKQWSTICLFVVSVVVVIELGSSVREFAFEAADGGKDKRLGNGAGELSMR